MVTSVKAGTRPPRAEKVAVVEEVRDRLAGSNAALLTEYRGLSVSGMETLRRQISEAGGEYKVYKNTLVRRAAHENGLDVLEPLLEGPTAIAFVRGDVATVAKVLRDFARANPSLVVKGGLVGTSLLDARTTASLAELPSREVLLAQVAGALAAPMQRFAALLAAVPQKMAYGLSALIDARGGVQGGPADAEPVAGSPVPAATLQGVEPEDLDATAAAPADGEASSVVAETTEPAETTEAE